MIEAYPLYWPEGRPRTGKHSRASARFDITFGRARDSLIDEVRLLRGKYTRSDDVIISSNVPLRRDGLPLANQRTPDDPGVAVYFKHQGRDMCFACDRWNKVEDNIQAIAKTIDALRGISRWGTGEMLQAAFRGFEALPAPSQPAKDWREVLGFSGAPADFRDVQVRFRALAGRHHPDRGGSAEKMSELNVAMQAARKYYGLPA